MRNCVVVLLTAEIAEDAEMNEVIILPITSAISARSAVNQSLPYPSTNARCIAIAVSSNPSRFSILAHHSTRVA